MSWRLRAVVRCDEHRLVTDVTRELDEPTFWRVTPAQLMELFRADVLARHPWIEDSIDYVALQELHVEQV